MVYNNGLFGEQSIPLQNVNHYGGEVPPNQDIVGLTNSRIDTQSMTTYGGASGIFGGPNSNFPQEMPTSSSIFMKYVKQKLVKKNKVETIP